MHEMATIADRRDELDDQELAFLEEQSELADEVARLDAALPELEAAAAAAGSRAGVAEARSPSELAALAAGRAELVGRLDAAAARSLRALAGPARRRRRRPLEGSRCSGCHLDLSTSELDDVQGRRRRRVRRLPAVRPPARALTGGAACSCGSSATAIVTVWFVFRDPRFDYRLLIVGSVLPLADGVTGGAARAAHASRSASCCWSW